MKRKSKNHTEEHPDDWEPPWMNPANDRKTPYTEEELKQFAEGFIESMGDTEALQKLIEKEGVEKAKEIVKESFRRQDERNLITIDIKGPVQ